VRPPVFEDSDAPQWYDERLDEFRDTDAVLPLSFNYASSERFLAQQGKFTMSFAPLQDQCSLIGKFGGPFVKKIIIPSTNKRDFLLRLRDINITAASLFPGVDGLGRSIEELISLGPVYGRATRIQTGRAADVSITNSRATLDPADVEPDGLSTHGEKPGSEVAGNRTYPAVKKEQFGIG
jgi:hypothetical protein